MDAASSRTLLDDYELFETILSGNDVIRGGRLGDYLEGFTGNDTIVGGGGSDHLYGYQGADTFRFETVRDSKMSHGDFVHDFSPRQRDKLDLSNIDAKQGVKGNQAFAFIGTAEFSKVKGQLRYEPHKSELPGDTVKWSTIEADINGDGCADFSFVVTDLTAIKKSYFIL
jgi:Ca2+-binding RTX toxin-like protein